MQGRDLAAIAGVACPVCHVPAGTPCRQDLSQKRQSPLHSARRRTWQTVSRYRLRRPRPAPPPEERERE